MNERISGVTAQLGNICTRYVGFRRPETLQGVVKRLHNITVASQTPKLRVPGVQAIHALVRITLKADEPTFLSVEDALAETTCPPTLFDLFIEVP